MRRKAAILVCAISFAFTVWIPLLAETRSGDLSGWYTDHLHNTYATWVFLHKGIKVYSDPFSEASEQVPYYPHDDHGWGAMPIAYPPGVFALFAPLTVLGYFTPDLSRAEFGLLCVIYILFCAHLSLYAVLRTLHAQVGRARWVVAVFVWLELMFLGLQGFFDVAYIGFGALALGAFAERKYERALQLICLASLFHYRALCLVFLGLLAFVEALRGRHPRDWPWRTLALIVGTGIVVISTFVLVYLAAQHTREAARPLVILGEVRTMTIAAACVVAVVGGLLGGRAVAAMSLGCLALALVERQPYWWHAGCVLLLPLSVGLLPRAKAPALMRVLLVLAAAFAARKVWRGEYLSLPRDLDKRFHVVERARCLVDGVAYVPPPQLPRRPQ